jgi:hypothetical protein
MSVRFCGIAAILVGTLSACAGGDAQPASPQASAEMSAASADAARGCLGPQPGHPTPAEQAAFVEEVAGLASTAEQQHGVPAAALAAIAILESGYGWSRLAQNTHNLMGWKYFPEAPAGGRDSWLLECPELGISDRFLVFRDRADAVDFVASQLATTDNYRADAERYQRDRANGVDVVEAVDHWVDGIADPYSSRPEDFRNEVRRVMNDTPAPGGEAPQRNLYSLSQAVSPARQS